MGCCVGGPSAKVGPAEARVRLWMAGWKRKNSVGDGGGCGIRYPHFVQESKPERSKSVDHMGWHVWSSVR